MCQACTREDARSVGQGIYARWHTQLTLAASAQVRTVGGKQQELAASRITMAHVTGATGEGRVLDASKLLEQRESELQASEQANASAAAHLAAASFDDAQALLRCIQDLSAQQAGGQAAAAQPEGLRAERAQLLDRMKQQRAARVPAA
jgi:hypothetical protein